jgi:hypothetical protein
MSGTETKNENSARGGAYGAYGPLSPAQGYGPKTDDPVSYQRYFTKIANPGPTCVCSILSSHSSIVLIE